MKIDDLALGQYYYWRKHGVERLGECVFIAPGGAGFREMGTNDDWWIPGDDIDDVVIRHVPPRDVKEQDGES